MKSASMSKMFIGVILVLLFYHTLLPQTQGNLTFEKEKIRINISDNECHFIGDYYFKNGSAKPVRANIFYPIVKNKGLDFPHFFSVIDLSKSNKIKFRTDSLGIFFSVNVPPFSLKTYRVEYRQQTHERRFEYILTTTALWGKPLKSADFEISLPKKFALDSLSFPFQRKEEKQNETIYFIHEENFMPRKNLIIRWR